MQKQEEHRSTGDSLVPGPLEDVYCDAFANKGKYKTTETKDYTISHALFH